MPTIKDVAKKAGVSIATVSNVLNGSRYVSDRLQERVLKAVKELDYEVDQVASYMKSNSTMCIGVILRTVSRILIPPVISGIQDAADKYKYNVIIKTTNDDFQNEKRHIKRLVSNRVDGLIINSLAPEDDTEYFSYLAHLSNRKKRIPVMSLDRDLTDKGISSIYINNINGGCMATEYLIENSCRTILHVGGLACTSVAQERELGYRSALEKHGIAFVPELSIHADYTPISGYRVVSRLLNSGVRFDGIFADNDQLAIGAH